MPQELCEGQLIEATFLAVDVVGHSEMMMRGPTTDVDQTLENIEDYVANTVAQHNGEVWAWYGDAGLCAFVGEQCATNGYLAALDIRGGLNAFNRNRKRCLVQQDVRLRIALHAGVARYKKDKGRVHSRDINFVVKLIQFLTAPNDIVISEDVYRGIMERARNDFREIGSFQSKTAYSQMGPPEPSEPDIHGFRWADPWSDEECKAAIQNLAERLISTSSLPLCLVGVYDPQAPGGVVVAKKLAMWLERLQPGASVTIGEIHIEGVLPEGPREVTDLTLPGSAKRVLVVDDVAFTGRTLGLACQAVNEGHPQAKELKCAVLAVGEDCLDRLERGNLTFELAHYSKVVKGHRVQFPWDIVGPTGALREQFDTQTPDLECMVRPWGWMEIFAMNRSQCSVRILNMKPGHQLSLQKHKQRDEFFVALDDGIQVQIGKDPNKIVVAQKGDYIFIPRGIWHRCGSPVGLTRSLEIAFGNYDQNDIERLEDDYGRPKQGDAPPAAGS